MINPEELRCRAGGACERSAGQERERKLKLYFEFDSPSARDCAMRTLNGLREERHEHDDRFSYFVGCRVDPVRPDAGMEISFSKNPEGLRNDFEQLLMERGIVPLEEYKTVDEEPRPGETINRNA